MLLGAASECKYVRGRATDWARGLHRLPNPDELRILYNMNSSEPAGDKVRRREGGIGIVKTIEKTWFDIVTKLSKHIETNDKESVVCDIWQR